MTVTVMELTAVNEENIEALATFLAMSSNLQKASRGRVVRVYEVAKTLIGQECAQTVRISEFPDKASIERYYNSVEYAALRPVRKQAFQHFHVCILADT